MRSWCPIVPATLQSQMDENIHVLGDATQNGDMPKSAYSANSQAKAAAMAIRHALTSSRAFKPRFSNTCWSLISTDNGVKVGASYVATDEKIAKVDGFISQNNEDDALRKQTYEESLLVRRDYHGYVWVTGTNELRGALEGAPRDF